MARGHKETPTHMEYGIWLIFDYWGKVRVTKQEPDLNRNERAMFLKVALPKALFTIPSLRASLTVDDQGSPQIDVRAVAEAVKLATGMDIDVRVHAAEDE